MVAPCHWEYCKTCGRRCRNAVHGDPNSRHDPRRSYDLDLAYVTHCSETEECRRLTAASGLEDFRSAAEQNLGNPASGGS